LSGRAASSLWSFAHGNCHSGEQTDIFLVDNAIPIDVPGGRKFLVMGDPPSHDKRVEDIDSAVAVNVSHDRNLRRAMYLREGEASDSNQYNRRRGYRSPAQDSRRPLAADQPNMSGREDQPIEMSGNGHREAMQIHNCPAKFDGQFEVGIGWDTGVFHNCVTGEAEKSVKAFKENLD
jgi:hypothetical protein